MADALRVVEAVDAEQLATDLGALQATLPTVYDAARFLDKKYTAWGKVVEGMENVDRIKRGEPVRDPDKIIKATIAADA